MSLLIKNNNNNNNNKKSFTAPFPTIGTTKTTTAASGEVCATACTSAILLHKYPTINTTPTKILTSNSLLSPLAVEATANVEAAHSSGISSAAISLFPLMEKSVELTQVTSATASASGREVFKTMPSFKVMSYQNFIALLTVLVCGLATANGLKCYMCGQYNEGVGSITPCLNYSEQYAHLYLKECSKKSEKYCVKYVSELSIVRDCATECAEKEIWETQTYCCTEDGCNGSNTMQVSPFVIMLPLVFYVLNEVMNVIKKLRR